MKSEIKISEKSRKADAQSELFDAKFWHLRKLNDISFFRKMKKAPTSFGEEYLLANENAKKLANMWTNESPSTADIEKFLIEHPINNIWYLISIFVQLEKSGIERGELIEIKKEKKRKFIQRRNGGLGLSEVNPKSQAMKKIKDEWRHWQELGGKGTNVAFAERMKDIYGENVTIKNITDNCTKWKNEKVLQNSNPFA